MNCCYARYARFAATTILLSSVIKSDSLFWSRDLRSYVFDETKQSIRITKVLRFQRICLWNQHGCDFGDTSVAAVMRCKNIGLGYNIARHNYSSPIAREGDTWRCRQPFHLPYRTALTTWARDLVNMSFSLSVSKAENEKRHFKVRTKIGIFLKFICREAGVRLITKATIQVVCRQCSVYKDVIVYVLYILFYFSSFSCVAF